MGCRLGPGLVPVTVSGWKLQLEEMLLLAEFGANVKLNCKL